MKTPLLQTKLYIPPPHQNLVSRPRLFAQLTQNAGRNLTLVSAPAGFGKTTLVSDWLRQGDLTALWLSLDETDNDTTRFLTYVIAALQQIDPAIGLTGRDMLQSSQPESPEVVITTLINDIAGVPADFILVLDDYHVIEAQPVHTALTFLLDHLPPSMHLVITTRVDPPLPLPRLRARGQMLEIREDDLRFTVDEAATFLNDVMGLDFSPDNVAALEARTEGWIAGLQLATLSLQGRDAQTKADFIAAFTGSHRYIVDYLAEEVLHQQPEPIQTFLLQTSILERLTASLCDAVVTAQDNAQATLEQLERDNLFIVSLDNERRWYRYHHLFAKFLRTRLLQTDFAVPPEGVSELHRRAVAWYAENGLLPEAVDHALAAEDFEWAASLIEQSLDIMIGHGELMTLGRWLDGLPDELVRARPFLNFTYAWVLVSRGDFEAAKTRLEYLETHQDNLDAPHRQILCGGIAAIRAMIAYAQEGIERAIELSNQALEALPENDTHFRGPIAVHLGMAYRWQGNVEAARKAYTETGDYGRVSHRIVTTLLSLTGLADLHMMQGQLHQAAERYQQALDFAADQGGQHGTRLPMAGLAHIGLGALRYEWNDLPGAEYHLQEGIELSKQFNATGFFEEGYVHLARLKHAQGQTDAAFETLRQAQQPGQKNRTPRTTAQINGCRVRLWLSRLSRLSHGVGNQTAAFQWAELKRVEEPHWDDELTYLREAEYLALARVLIAREKTDEQNKNAAQQAINLLARLHQLAEADARTGSVIEILMLQVLALDAQGNTDQALTTLEQTLTLAEPGGYIRTFADEGPPLKKLLQRRQNAENVRINEYVDKLLYAFDSEGVAQPRPSPLASQSLVEPLSERELEVLQLIADGDSNREIANELVLAIGTVKKHISNIFGKLNVTSRTQAVARARELDLIE